ncbi:unnamed protein product [Rotaria sp. Silwood1]|nr:unnamed protein product [Rotaria sp. Silwood1]CAF3639393.1 unnamed protein product [Rotaria sp. Silwood1]CAF4917489.1 unnamed protein product [Rotaria sp. Silwood1]
MTSLKIMTFNIACCKRSQHGSIDVARTIQTVQPDLIALQEVDKFTYRSGTEIDQSYELARLTGLSHSVFVNSMDFSGGQYGDAILSRYAFDTVQLFHLDGRCQGETRSLGIISMKITDEYRLYFGVTHLEHEVNILREAQTKEVIELYRRIVPDKEPFILAGDFNDSPTSRTVELLLTDGGLQLPCDKCPTTYPADHPTETIDYIFLNAKAMEIFEVKSYRTMNDEKSSDHLPLVMELRRK